MLQQSSWFGPIPAIPSGTDSAGQFGSPETLTIATGVAAKVGGQRNLLLAGEGGLDDQLDNITGYAEGDMIVIGPASDTVTITVADSANMNLQGADFTMNNVYDSMVLLNLGSDKWKELSRSAN